jgi:hypothetical protein
MQLASLKANAGAVRLDEPHRQQSLTDEDWKKQHTDTNLRDTMQVKTLLKKIIAQE